MSRGVPIVGIIVLLLLALGFHFVSFGHKVCVVPKSNLTFDTTFASNRSEAGFALSHPYIYARINSGHGACVSY